MHGRHALYKPGQTSHLSEHLNKDITDAQSEKDDSDYPNNANKSGDEVPFMDSEDDEEEEPAPTFSFKWSSTLHF